MQTNLISDKHGVAQAWQLQFDDLFDENRRNIFTSGRHDQLFDPARDPEESVLALNPEVAGSKPTVLSEDLLRLGGVVQVSHHHVTSTHHDFISLVAEKQNLIGFKILTMSFQTLITFLNDEIFFHLE